MKKKQFLGLVIAFVLFGLGTGYWYYRDYVSEDLQQRYTQKIRESFEYPPFVILTNKKKEMIGRAIPVKNNVFITADHIMRHHREIYWGDKKAKVLARDFSHDLLIVEIDKKNQPLIQFSSPDETKTFYRMDINFKKQEHAIRDISTIFFAENQEKENVMSLSGTADKSESGSPIFDRDNNVIGMVIGSNHVENKIFAVKSDWILEFLTEFEQE